MLNRVNTPMNALALQVLQPTPKDFVLEVGFGGGALLAQLSRVVVEGRVSGADFSSVAVEACGKRFARLITSGRVDLHCANVEHLPFAPDTFAKVCTVNTIYFWSAPPEALAEIRRVLKPDGLVVVCLTPRALMKDREVMRHGFTLYEPEEVSAFLSVAGFRDVGVARRQHRRGECVAVYGRKSAAL
jgi:ubiquinone/menaquinone biosynthesis C-methylase UbiE